MDAQAESDLAGWLAEAFETGNALAPVPPSHIPADAMAGEAVAAATLERLGMAPCGLRLLPGPDGAPLAGPMLEGRLLSPATPVALATLRHARASAAIVAVLAEALLAEAAAPPVIGALHPAIDIAAWRLRDAPMAAGLMAADLAGLGLVVVGRRARAVPPLPAGPVPVRLTPAGRRAAPTAVDLAAALAEAAAAARRLGGLPAGAVLVLAGLGPALAPVPGVELAASLGALGRVRAVPA
jgi:2-keto-4-pentenoate hydratase